MQSAESAAQRSNQGRPAEGSASPPAADAAPVVAPAGLPGGGLKPGAAPRCFLGLALSQEGEVLRVGWAQAPGGPYYWNSISTLALAK